MAEADDLWRTVFEILGRDLPPRDASPQARLNRLIRERNWFTRELSLNPETCSISLEEWPSARLRELDRWHKRFAPRGEEGPLIVAYFEGKAYLLDGCNRVNVWLRSKRNAVHEVIAIRT
jgi:hypothetical protein